MEKKGMDVTYSKRKSLNISLPICMFIIVGLESRKRSVLSLIVLRHMPAPSQCSINLCWMNDRFDGPHFLSILCYTSQHEVMNVFICPNYSTAFCNLKRKVFVKLGSLLIGCVARFSTSSKHFPAQMLKSSLRADWLPSLPMPRRLSWCLGVWILFKGLRFISDDTCITGGEVRGSHQQRQARTLST